MVGSIGPVFLDWPRVGLDPGAPIFISAFYKSENTNLIQASCNLFVVHTLERFIRKKSRLEVNKHDGDERNRNITKNI